MKTRAQEYVLLVYLGSNAQATKSLYERLENKGPKGVLAANLIRAQKSSSRAKKYRGGIPGMASYKTLAYRHKQWSMDNLCRLLGSHAGSLGIGWGWKIDPLQSFHAWVLYVDLPTGQVSFHSGPRGFGPDYPGDWDGVRGVSDKRIIDWAASVIIEEAAVVGQMTFDSEQNGGGRTQAHAEEATCQK
jgi:hypothetical protein